MQQENPKESEDHQEPSEEPQQTERETTPIRRSRSQILISTFGYMDLDFINGTGSFQDQGTYGLTYAEYQEALQGVNKIDTQVAAIPVGDRDDYAYLVSGLASYSEYPPATHPFYIIPLIS